MVLDKMKYLSLVEANDEDEQTNAKRGLLLFFLIATIFFSVIKER